MTYVNEPENEGPRWKVSTSNAGRLPKVSAYALKGSTNVIPRGL
jgi:hypothetical protein